MTQETQANLFIRTLAEMLDDDRRRRKAHLRAQNKAQAERFRHAFLVGAADGGSSAEWTGAGRQTPHHVVQMMLDR